MGPCAGDEEWKRRMTARVAKDFATANVAVSARFELAVDVFNTMMRRPTMEKIRQRATVRQPVL
jgi:uncharacterized membrane protein